MLYLAIYSRSQWFCFPTQFNRFVILVKRGIVTTTNDSSRAARSVVGSRSIVVTGVIVRLVANHQGSDILPGLLPPRRTTGLRLTSSPGGSLTEIGRLITDGRLSILLGTHGFVDLRNLV
jgi:hypothetical protein